MKKLLAAVLALVVLVFVATPTLAATYLANTKSMKFHYSGCSTIKHPNAANFVPYESRSACIADGYQPCGRCKP